MPLFRALAQSRGVSGAVYISHDGVPAARAAQGWRSDWARTPSVVVAPTPEQISGVIREAPPNTVHIFSGIHGPSTISHGLQEVLTRGDTFGIMSEPRAMDGAGTFLRLGHSWATEGRIRTQASFVLAIGREGPIWFRLAGYDPGKIFPFAYFLDRPDTPSLSAAAGEHSLHIGYVGRLERAKGFHLLLSTMSQLPEAHLTVVGSGTLEAALGRCARRRPGSVTHLGILPSEQIPAFMASIDVLVLPSVRKDGWGAVVTEALLSGTPAVVSRRVGASLVIERHPFLGRVAPENSVRALSDAIRSVAKGVNRADLRSARAHWARAHLSAEAGAEALLSIVQGRTTSPDSAWLAAVRERDDDPHRSRLQ
ncbi:glycosyltransferase family 4 protein [Phenylobacterium sp. J367]|uniref:glycosyltransferase family 4 protein n=1 Tax=Phenylobacterium sp. J367 TaxID=2898435 RepID=UPI0035AF9ED3